MPVARGCFMQLVWNCDMPLTRTGVRGELALDIAVQDFGCLTVPILAKVYKHSDQSATHGAECMTSVPQMCGLVRIAQHGLAFQQQPCWQVSTAVRVVAVYLAQHCNSNINRCLFLS